jgi:nucleotide-binding universal stress UspA family protein
VKTFLAECEEGLGQMEHALIVLETRPHDADLMVVGGRRRSRREHVVVVRAAGEAVELAVDDLYALRGQAP